MTINLGNISQVSAQQAISGNSFNTTVSYLKSNVKQKPRIAVLDFEYNSVADEWRWWLDSNAKGVSEILVNKLVEGGNFTVIERSKIDAILSEQNLGASGRVDSSTAAQIGKILGVDIIVIGSITGFNIEQDGGGVRIPRLGRVGGGKTRANVKLNLRVVNTTTAEILLTAEGNGSSSRGDGAINIRGYSVDSSSRKEAKLLTTATVDAINQVVEKLNTGATKLAAAPRTLTRVNALIADISGNTVILNKGTGEGFQQGMKLSIERVTREVKDPATGKVLRQVTQPMGTIEITEADAQSSVGKIISGGSFKVGDMAKPVK
ncbi:MAG: CsgG/HfaB family protein [Nostocaceae cyanobacterium]|nr:CsgG/HfaB family protein [Nostocaceae cyanobacterium]